MSVEYTPQNVSKGLRDFIAWETRYKPRVDIYDMGHGMFEARVSLDVAAKTDTIEASLAGILPPGYTLKMTWTD